MIATAPGNDKSRPAAKQPVRYNSTCRILTEEDNGYCGVSRTEDDAVEGYVHKSDLVLGGLAGNLPGRAEARARCFPPPTAAAPKPGTAGLGSPTQRVSER